MCKYAKLRIPSKEKCHKISFPRIQQFDLSTFKLQPSQS